MPKGKSNGNGVANYTKGWRLGIGCAVVLIALVGSATFNQSFLNLPDAIAEGDEKQAKATILQVGELKKDLKETLDEIKVLQNIALTKLDTIGDRSLLTESELKHLKETVERIHPGG